MVAHLWPFLRYGYGCLEPSLADFATRKSQGRLCHTVCTGQTLPHATYRSLATASIANRCRGVKPTVASCAMAALNHEQVMNPSGPGPTSLESGVAERVGSRGEDVSSSGLDPSLDRASSLGGQRRTGVEASFVAEGATDVVPQTTERGGGGLQGREAASSDGDHHRRLLSERTATPCSYGAADAGTQAVALREQGSRAAVDVQAGAGTSGEEANAIAVAVQDERLQFGTPRSSRTAWADVPANEGGAGFSQGLRWLGRLGEYFRAGNGSTDAVGPPGMWPSPFPSPERLQQEGRSGPAGSLFSAESLRRLQAVQDRAPLLYGTPQRAHNRTQTPSSSGLKWCRRRFNGN